MAPASSSSVVQSPTQSGEISGSCNEKRECEAKKRVPGGLLLLSAAIPRPFNGFGPDSYLKLADTVPAVPPLLRHLHSSFASAADSCFASLHSLASQNPFFKNLASLSFRLQTFLRQVPCRNLRSMNSFSNHSFAAILPGDSVAGVVVANGILNFLNIYNTMLVVRLVLTWFPNSPPAIVSPLSLLCDPYLNIFRGLIPPLGGTLDLSPILAFLVLNAFTSTASALPAELPSSAVSQESFCHTRFSGVTTSQKKWMRRLCGNRRQRGSGSSRPVNLFPSISV